MMFQRNILVALCVFMGVFSSVVPHPKPLQEIREHSDAFMHPHHPSQSKALYNDDENTAEYWRNVAQDILKENLKKRPNTNIAKNVIIFLGDGMSIPTLGAARAYMGQQEGGTGENSSLSFEKFPFTGLSKTYCVDKQVADSACSATAYLGGVKANEGTIGVTGEVKLKDCEASLKEENHVESIAVWALNANKSAGVVTTARITHASPAGVYAHTSERDWESDYFIAKDGYDPNVCPDIAKQLVRSSPGNKLKVILGGGRRYMIPQNEVDEEGFPGTRLDGVNLINEWQDDKAKAGVTYRYVWNRTDLISSGKDKNLEYLMGLFDTDHCEYQLDANPDIDPTLSEMVEAAINMLSRDSNGYFLFVEGGRIDHAHHDNLPKKALEETVQFSKAIDIALQLTNVEDTLIVVTSDHAHTMSYAGYAERGNDILKFAGIADDNLVYPTLAYANGPGYRKPEVNGSRHDMSQDDTDDKDYVFPALAPLDSETHGGDDVGIFALGPWSHLFVGMFEQNAIPHIMAYASCIGSGATACD